MLKQFISKASETATRFAADRRGNFGIIATAVTPMLLIATGVAVNLAHLHNVRTNMSQTLDSALTSTTREVIANGRSRNEAIKVMTGYINANGNAGLSEADKLELKNLIINPTDRTVTADLYSDVALPFSVFGLAKTLPVSVTATTAYTDQPVEVAMMLDLTGSMNEPGTPKNGRRQTKLDNLKDAAAQAVSELLSRNVPGMTPRVRVALIPYSQGVNTGELGEANWIEGGIIGEVPVGLNALDQLLLRPIKILLTALLGDRKQDRCTTERKVRSGGSVVADLSDDGPGTAMVNRAQDLQSFKCPTATIVPLTAESGKLLDEIKAFAGVGGTAGHIGIQWTRYMLSPKWGGFLRDKTGAQAVPGNYGTQSNSVRKIAILLTDGEFNTQYAKGGSSASFAQAHCTAMKQNIEVFTIGFMLNNSAAKTTMSKCASPDESGGIKHYYEVSTAEELTAAFQAISANTELVRLTN